MNTHEVPLQQSPLSDRALADESPGRNSLSRPGGVCLWYGSLRVFEEEAGGTEKWFALLSSLNSHCTAQVTSSIC